MHLFATSSFTALRSGWTPDPRVCEDQTRLVWDETSTSGPRPTSVSDLTDFSDVVLKSET